MDGELISIIIPVYKVEPYLSQCMETVLQQTYRNLEIILIDDGSPDNCPRLCDDYAVLDPRIKVIHKANGGVSDARNAGLKAVKGEYISFIDSDDWVDYDFIERLYRAAKIHGADISSCGIIKVYEKRHKRRNFYEAEQTFTTDEAVLEVLKNDRMSSHLWNKLYKKRLLEGIEFPKGKCYEDLCVMHKVFAGAKRVTVICDWKYYYRQRPDSIIYTSSVRNLADYFGAFYLRYAEEGPKYEKIRPFLIKQAVASALDLLKSGNPNGECALEIERAKNFLREIRRNNALLRMLGPNARAKVKYPRGNQWIIRGIKLYHKLFPPKETNREPDWNALRAENACILLGYSESENLGDSTIGLAEKFFFEREGKTLVELSEAQLRTFGKKIRRAVRPQALILLHGGGCMGSQYLDQEDIRSWAIRCFPKNTIVHFPQTVYFSDTPEAEKIKNTAVELYVKHPDLTLFAREPYSYEIMRSLYKNRVEITPDMVLSMPPYESAGDREGALLILRSDVEAALDIGQYFAIKNKLAQSGLPVEVSDTRLSRRIPFENREKELNAFFEKMASKKIVVTDRLHAMIFSAITGTPCIAFGNYNHKVLGGYQWLKDLGYIRFCDSAEEFDQAFQSLDLGKKYSYRNNGLEGTFQALRQAIHR
jgi:exopolysaccharide biosynthesis predicted pyruvyltransferase EpsI